MRPHPALITWPRRALALLGVVTVATLAACASPPPSAPEVSLAAGAASLDAARSSGAPEYAPRELDAARGKLDQARALAQQGRSRDALRMAEEADVDAQLARAQAATERSRRAVSELEASLRSLREELGRAPAATPSAIPPRSPQ